MELTVPHVLNMKRFPLLLLLVNTWYLGSCELRESTAGDQVDFYKYSVEDISGVIVSLDKYRGKVSLVVNVASQCGYTHGHYRALISLQEYFGLTEKFNVLAFPCNQFGQQEPGTERDIMDFVNHKMGANFPLFAKVDVIGPDASPAWSYLTEHAGHTPTWNFWKYLVDHNGHVLNAWGPYTGPDQLYPDIKDALSNIETQESSTNRGSNLGGSRNEL